MRTRIKLTRALRVLAVSAVLASGLAASMAAVPAHAAQAGPACACRHHDIAYVSAVVPSAALGVVIPVDTVTGRALRPVTVGGNPQALVVTPDGRKVYVANQAPPGSVSVIRTRTGTAQTISIPGWGGWAPVMAVTPNGKTVYATLGGSVIVPIRTADDKVLKPIDTGVQVTGMAFTPDGRKLYASSWDGKIVPISTATNTAGEPILVKSYETGIPVDIAMAPDGRTLWAASGNLLTPISTATDKPGTPIVFDQQIGGIVISPDGRTGYVAVVHYGGPTDMFPVNLVTHEALEPITLPGGANGGRVFTPDGKTLYVMQQIAGTVTPIRTATGTVLPAIKVVGMPAGIGITPDGKTVYVLNGAQSLTQICTATNKAGPLIPLTGDPTGIAFRAVGKAS